VVGCWRGYLSGADLYMAQLMPLPLTVYCFSKSYCFLPFCYRLTGVVPDKGPFNGVGVFFLHVLIFLTEEGIYLARTAPYSINLESNATNSVSVCRRCWRFLRVECVYRTSRWCIIIRRVVLGYRRHGVDKTSVIAVCA